MYHKSPSCLISNYTTRICNTKIQVVNNSLNDCTTLIFSQKFELFNFQINDSDFWVESQVVLSGLKLQIRFSSLIISDFLCQRGGAGM